MEGLLLVDGTHVSFLSLFIDQGLEQQIKILKGHGGMTGLSRDEASLDRMVTVTPYLATIVHNFFCENCFL